MRCNLWAYSIWDFTLYYPWANSSTWAAICLSSIEWWFLHSFIYWSHLYCLIGYIHQSSSQNLISCLQTSFVNILRYRLYKFYLNVPNFIIHLALNCSRHVLKLSVFEIGFHPNVYRGFLQNFFIIIFYFNQVLREIHHLTLPTS